MTVRLRGLAWTALLSGAWGLVAASSCRVDKDGYTFDDAGHASGRGGSAGGGNAGQSGSGIAARMAGGADPGGQNGIAGDEASGGAGRESGGTGPETEGGRADVGGDAGALTAGGTTTGGTGEGGMPAGSGGTLDMGGTAGAAGGRGGSAAGKGGTSAGSAGTAGSAGAINTHTNPDHCGALGRVCSSANVNVRACTGGLCTSTCKAASWNVRLPAAPAGDDGCEAECPISAGSASMLRLPQGYCIDRTEVTRGQYQAWLDTDPTTSGQTADCSWNATFTPVDTCIATAYQGTGAENHPMVCVDWCDATAYCRAMNKRLCGRIGGGMNAFADISDASRSQWFNACVSGPTNNAFPYDSLYRSLACNGADYQIDRGTNATVPVGTINGCQSSVAGYSGVFDLSGNVWEWENSCQGDSLSSLCRARGGAYYNSEELLRCDDSGDFELNRDSAGSFLGFRCCAD
jgi:formylglycine-generating enzyme